MTRSSSPPPSMSSS
uniref:Uncharacterized protein n=1 Tax=Arundo donax TaxID=35708 RepID=A0A0A9U6R7_ARUDO